MPTITSENRAQAIVSLVAAEALPALMGEIRMANLVTREFQRDLGVAGQTVSIEIQPIMTANNIAEGGTIQTQNPQPGFAQISLHSHVEASFAISDMSKVFNANGGPALLRNYMRPAMIAIAERIETDLHKLYPRIDGSTGATNAPISEDALDDADTLLFKNKVPLSLPRYLSCHADTYSTLRNIARFTEADKIGTGNAIVTGDVGRLKGFNIFRSHFAVKDGSNVFHNIAFVPEAAAIVFRRLPTIDQGAGAIATFVDFENFGMRIIMSYNASKLEQQITVDVLYGCAIIRPNFAVDIVSNG